MNQQHRMQKKFAQFCLCLSLLCLINSASLLAETFYIDSRNGNDANAGTKEQPLKTLARAAELVNTSMEVNIVKTGSVQIELDTPRPAELSWHMPRHYLHIVPGTFGSELGAGLFTKQ